MKRSIADAPESSKRGRHDRDAPPPPTSDDSPPPSSDDSPPPSSDDSPPPTLDLLAGMEEDREAFLTHNLQMWNSNTIAWPKKKFMKAFNEVSLQSHKDYAIFLLMKLLRGVWHTAVDFQDFQEFHRLCTENPKEKPTPLTTVPYNEFAGVDFEELTVSDDGRISFVKLHVAGQPRGRMAECRITDLQVQPSRNKIKLSQTMLKVLQTIGICGTRVMKPEVMKDTIFEMKEIKSLRNCADHVPAEKLGGLKITKFMSELQNEIYFQF